MQDAILDGEIVVMGEGGPKFHALMMNREPASYVAFDLLWLDGGNLRGRPLWRRKAALEKLVSGTRDGYVEHSDDPRLMDAVVRMDVERHRRETSRRSLLAANGVAEDQACGVFAEGRAGGAFSSATDVSAKR